MISDGDLPELASYRRIERRLPFESRFEYSGLVIPLQNNSLPGHRWFRFKEGFSADLLDTVIAGPVASQAKTFQLAGSVLWRWNGPLGFARTARERLSGIGGWDRTQSVSCTS